jgi:uncharacterized protein YchJ
MRRQRMELRSPGVRVEDYKAAGLKSKRHGKIGRNDKCYCGSGVKFKHCCYRKVKRDA